MVETKQGTKDKNFKFVALNHFCSLTIFFLKISLDLEIEVHHAFLYSVDGTHCRIKEPRSNPDKLWYSHKYNKPGVSYEIALHLYKDKVAWVNGRENQI